MTFYKAPVYKLLSLLLSVSFLLVLVMPTFELLISKYEPASVHTTMEKEGENKESQDAREFFELDFDKNIIMEVHFFMALSSLFYGFSKLNVKTLDFKSVFPPPEFV